MVQETGADKPKSNVSANIFLKQPYRSQPYIQLSVKCNYVNNWCFILIAK